MTEETASNGTFPAELEVEKDMRDTETPFPSPLAAAAGRREPHPPMLPVLGRLVLREPDYLRADSAWLEHIPFAFWLVEHLRPKTIVELGVFSGVSYCAFCQAVTESGLDSKCYGVDTFEGCDHAGFYGANILAELRSYHDPHHGGFSSLIPSSFEDALKHFDDGTIDLLHIDGSHYYEDVKQDFESWLPKLSRRAVVLFHDTNVRERDFGVYRLWSEIKDRYPSFEFVHGHGLGVLATGAEMNPVMSEFFATAASNQVARRQFFSALGSRLTFRTECGAMKHEIQTLRGDASALSNELNSLRAHQAEMQQALTEKSATLEAARTESAALRQAQHREKQQHQRRQEDLRKRQRELEQQQESLQSQNERLQNHVKSGRRTLKKLVTTQRNDVARLTRSLESVRESYLRNSFKSWFAAFFPWLKGRRVRRQHHLIRGSGLFDSAWYASQLPSGFKARDPLLHYLRIGWKCDLSAHRLFDSAWYRQTYRKELAGKEPLTDFLDEGWRKNRNPHPLFDAAWYAKMYPDVEKKGANPLADYLNRGAGNKRWPHPLFDGDWYVSQYGDRLSKGQTPLEHYLDGKNAQKCWPNPLFDPVWYAKEYLKSTGGAINPLLHYVSIGTGLGFNPNPLFDSAWYLHEYPQVRESGLHPLQHYIQHGIWENLMPHPLCEPQELPLEAPSGAVAEANSPASYHAHLPRLRDDVRAVSNASSQSNEEAAQIMEAIEPWFDAEYYLSQNPDVETNHLDPLEHFVKYGEREGRKPRSDFDPVYYLATNYDVRLSDTVCALHPFYHYVMTGKEEGRSGVPVLEPVQLSECEFPEDIQASSIGLAVHLFYQEVWETIQDVIAKFPVEARLYISLVKGHTADMAEVILSKYPGARISVVENRGRDVLPFLQQLKQMQDDGVQVALKIHGKKSITKPNGLGDKWRDGLYKDLAPSAGYVSAIVGTFQARPDLGVFIPYNHCSALQRGFENNHAEIVKLASSIGAPHLLADDAKSVFPAGTMFWFRPHALQSLAKLGLSSEDFPLEAGQVDGTVAHAIERIIGLAPRVAGFQVGTYKWSSGFGLLQPDNDGIAGWSETATRLERKYPGITKPDGVTRIDDLARRTRVPAMVRMHPLPRPRLNFVFPDLDPDIVFGGYIAGLEFAAAMHARYDIRFVLVAHPFTQTADLVAKFASNPRVGPMLAEAEFFNLCEPDAVLPVAEGDFFCAFSSWDCLLVSKLARMVGQPSFFYFCQEDEASFHQFDAHHALISHVQELPHFTIFNSELLRQHFRAEKLGVYAVSPDDGDANSAAFNHALVPTQPATLGNYQGRRRFRVLFYARPEWHAKRNLFEMGMLALREFVRRVSPGVDEVEFTGVGTMGYEDILPLGNGHTICIRPKLDLKSYSASLAGYDIGLSLMYAPHPGVVHFEMASAGMLAVTNTFGVRTAQCLTDISPNLVPVDPSPHGITEGLMEAWSRRKDFADRIKGADFAWNRSWEESFNADFMAAIHQHAARCLQQPA